MKRGSKYCKEFENGNIVMKFDKEMIEEMKKDEVLIVSEALSLLDCVFIGETFCLNNFETGHLVYNCYSDLVYIFPWSCLETLKEGKQIRLYARKPTEDDRELIKQEGY